MFLKKRNAVAAMIVLFICVAVYLNWSYTQGIGKDDAVDADSPKILGEATLTNQEEEGKKEQVTKEEKEKSPKDTVANDYFTNARMEKQKARDSALNTLKETTNQENISQEARDRATASIETLATGAVAESRIETLVRAKGFTDCVALISRAKSRSLRSNKQKNVTAARGVFFDEMNCKDGGSVVHYNKTDRLSFDIKGVLQYGRDKGLFKPASGKWKYQHRRRGGCIHRGGCGGGGRGRGIARLRQRGYR